MHISPRDRETMYMTNEQKYLYYKRCTDNNSPDGICSKVYPDWIRKRDYYKNKVKSESELLGNIEERLRKIEELLAL